MTDTVVIPSSEKTISSIEENPSLSFDKLAKNLLEEEDSLLFFTELCDAISFASIKYVINNNSILLNILYTNINFKKLSETRPSDYKFIIELFTSDLFVELVNSPDITDMKKLGNRLVDALNPYAFNSEFTNLRLMRNAIDFVQKNQIPSKSSCVYVDMVLSCIEKESFKYAFSNRHVLVQILANTPKIIELKMKNPQLYDNTIIIMTNPKVINGLTVKCDKPIDMPKVNFFESIHDSTSIYKIGAICGVIIIGGTILLYQKMSF